MWQSAAPKLLGRQTRLVSCHLGGSSSICAIDRGRSVDTTMGFSPQSGLENATRHGDLDVFAVLFMMERHGWTARQSARTTRQEWGTSGPFGNRRRRCTRSGTCRRRTGNERAAEALRVFVYQVKKTIGAYAAAMGGLDAVAFHRRHWREFTPACAASCCQGLDFLGIVLDPEFQTSKALATVWFRAAPSPS